MKTLPAIIRKLTQARVLAQVPVILIRPVSDHSVPTLDDPELASTYPMVRTLTAITEASNTSSLQSVTFPLETMSHLPSPVPGAVDSLTRRIRFSLINQPYRGFASYFDYLTRNAPLDRADLTLELVTVPPRELGTDPLHLHRLDFQGASEGEEQDWFKGRIERVISVGDTIECEGKSTLPVVPWKLVPDDGSDPRDRGVRLPFPLGSGAVVRCTNLLVGELTTTNEQLAIGQLEIELADASGFGSTGTAMFASEAILWSGKTDNRLTGLTRAALGTLEADHVIGVLVYELDDVVLGVASFPVSAVTGLFIRSFTTGASIEIPKLLYSVDFDDEATAPGSSGDGITTITLSDTQMASIIHEILAKATVTQQAVYSTATIPGLQAQTDSIDFGTPSVLFDQASGQGGTWATVTTTPIWTRVQNGPLRQGLRNTFPAGLSVEGLSGLRTARFDFQLDVTTLQAPITVGLVVNGAEGVLSGFVDGAVVASFEILTTGIKSVSGTLFGAVEGANVGDLDDVVIDFIKSEMTSQANPAVVFEVTGIDIVYGFVDDVVQVTNFFPMDDFTDDQAGTFGGTWQGVWQNLGTDQPDQGEDGTEDHRLIGKMLVDPLDDTPIVDLEFEFESFGVNNAPVNTFTSHFGFEASTWTGKITSVPADFGHVHAADSTTTINSIKAMTPVAGLTSLDLVGVQIDVENEGVTGGAPNLMDCQIIGLNLTYFIKDDSVEPVPRTQDLQIQAAAGGIGLEFFAAVDGPVAPDATYSVASGTLLVHPSDLIRFWLQEVGGIPAASVDDTTFDVAVTDLVGYEWGYDGRNLGDDWESILLRMGYEARANIVKPSDVLWKMLTADSSFSFGAAAATIDSTEKLGEIHKDNRETHSRLTVFSDHDPRFEGLDNRSFRQVQTTDPLDADVIAVEVEFGRNDAEPYFLFCHNGDNPAGVTDWRLYMEQELGRQARIFTGRVDHWDAYALEVGDVVDLVATSGTTKCRVLESRRDPRQGFVMRFVEVT